MSYIRLVEQATRCYHLGPYVFTWSLVNRSLIDPPTIGSS